MNQEPLVNALHEKVASRYRDHGVAIAHPEEFLDLGDLKSVLDALLALAKTGVLEATVRLECVNGHESWAGTVEDFAALRGKFPPCNQCRRDEASREFWTSFLFTLSDAEKKK